MKMNLLRIKPATQVASALSIILLIILAIAILGVFTSTTREAKGAYALLMLLSLLMTKTPVAVSMSASSLMGIYAISGFSAVSGTLAQVPFSAAANWSLTVIPMFVLMGIFLARSGASDKIFEASRLWLGRLPGGLAVTANAAGVGLSAVSGSTIGITHALGRVSIPAMLRRGYSPKLATGAILIAGTGGQLIPPSILMVIYAGIAGTAMGPQLVSGIVPGVIVALAYILAIIIYSTVFPKIAPRDTTSYPLKTKLKSFLGTIPVLLIAVVVVGSMLLGLATATEAGAIGAAASMLVLFTSKSVRNKMQEMFASLSQTAYITASIMFLVIGAGFTSKLLAISGLTRFITDKITAMGLPVVVFLIIILFFYLVLGMFIDSITMLLLTVPILLPILEQYGVNALWFGVFAVLLAELAMITPPVGLLAYIVHKMVQRKEVGLGQKITLSTVFQGSLWFLPIPILILIILIFYPDLALFLPEMIDGN